VKENNTFTSSSNGHEEKIKAMAYSKPGIVTSVKVKGQDGKIVATWDVPETNGGIEISSYSVIVTPGEKTCTTSEKTCTITGLENGTSYTSVISARNLAGEGVGSAPVVTLVQGPSSTPKPTESQRINPEVPADGSPSEPLNLTAVPGNAHVVLAWEKPVYEGDGPVTTYLVTSTPGDKTCTAQAPVTTCTVTGLENGTQYNFVVTASNEVEATKNG